MKQNSINELKLISNNYTKGHKVLTTLIKQLKECDTFVFSVAFITNSGIASIIHELEECRKNNKKGLIITTDYLLFSEPSALKRLHSFDNIDLLVIDNHSFHIKGYIFEYGEHNQYIIGSSNLSQGALTSNLEWNVNFSSYHNEEIVQEIKNEIDYLLRVAKRVDDNWLAEYTKKYNSKPKVQETSDTPRVLLPNKLQMKGLHALDLHRQLNHNKALVISATGTGKTYLAAFDAKNVNPKRLLFVVHREQIAKAALKSFQHVFGNERTYGLYTGRVRDSKADFIFTTIQTMSKSYHYKQFESETFQYIIYDEAHHIGAASYQKILDYFDAQFTLAMTATPERNDQNNIYEYMDHNIAFEIRLNEALKEDMLSPFHYYGISDLLVDGRLIDDKTKFNDLICEQRVNHIINKITLYGYSGDRVRGLMFCSRVEEAQKLSALLNDKGLRTIALSGSNSQDEREQAINRLTSYSVENPLDYILTVDIFNEGIDIPEINQIVMLRPTQSAIIFVQQLGRGLRKLPNKEYVVVVDFIGNYKNNFFIPIALSGDRTFDKETLRKFIKKGNHTIPGESTIHFDNVVEERVLSAVKQTNFATKAFLKDAYVDLKFKLNHIPLLKDFYEFGSVDPRIIIQYKPSYYRFLKEVDDKYEAILTEKQDKILIFMCKEILYSKRLEEIAIIELLLENDILNIDQVINEYNFSEQTIQHALRILSLDFFKNDDKKKYGGHSLIDLNNRSISLSEQFKNELSSIEFNKLVTDVIVTANQIVQNEFHNASENPFTLYKKYTRKDVCKLLQWEKDTSSTMFGYIAKEEATPIFVTYNKDEDISESTSYEDRIIDNEHFVWYTKSNRRMESKDVQLLKNHEQTNMKIDLFIKKDNDEKDFFYVGEMVPRNFTPESIMNDKNELLPIVKVDMFFKEQLHDDMIAYFTDK